MTKTIALALAGVVLAFAVCRAETETCKPPNVTRAEMVSGGTGGPLMCYKAGFCFHVSPSIVGAWIRIACLTPQEEFEAMKRADGLK